MNLASGNVILVALIYLAAVVDSAIFPRLAVGEAAPDALALLAVVWLTLAPGDKSFLAAALIGLAADLCGPGRLGIGVSCYLVIGVALQQAQRRLAWHHSAMHFGLALTAAVLLVLLLAFCQWMAAGAAAPLGTLLMRVLGTGLYTALIALLVLSAFIPLWRRTASLGEVY